MTPEVFAEWLRRIGHRVIRTRSSYWFDAGPRVYQAFPYHWIIQPEEEELLELLSKENAIGLRYSTPLEAEVGACSYHIVYEHAGYDFGDLDSSVRGQVRRGLKACQVGAIPLERYAREGWLLEQDTQDRQGRRSRHGSARWKRMVEAAAGLDGFEVWGAEVEGKLAAAIMCLQVDEAVNLLYQQSHREYLPLRVNNALVFETTRALLARPGIRMIHYGLHSLDAPASVDQFKIRLGYQVKPVRQRVMFHPRLAPWLGTGASSLLERLAGEFPKNDFVKKAAGFTKFYLNGNLPLARQAFPENLESKKGAICQAGTAHPLPAFAGPEVEGRRVQIRPATPGDIHSLVALHLRCFSEDDHFALMLGPSFIRSAFRWFLTSQETLVLVARLGEKIVGFTALANRPYNIPMLRACKGSVLLGFLRRPWLLLRPDWLKRLGHNLFSKGSASARKVAQIAFTGIDQEVQGRGIGWALKQASIQVCRDWGVDIVVTGVHRKNLRAKALNVRAGFVEVPELSAKHLIHLRLDLTASTPGGLDEAGPA